MDSNFFINKSNQIYKWDYFLDHKSGSSFCSQIVPQELLPIVELFLKDNDFSNLSSLYAFGNKLYINFQKDNSRSELILRIDKHNWIVIENIEFANKRQGNMTALYTILKEIKNKYSFDKIMIESCGDEMKNWCRKYGFIEEYINSDNFIDN